MTLTRAPRRQYTDAAIVTAICFGWFILLSIQAVLAGFPTEKFDDASLLSIAVFEIVMGALALAFLRYRGYPLAPLVPLPNAVGCLVGLALYLASWVASWPVDHMFGAKILATQPIEQMVEGAELSMPTVLAVSVVNGLYEEVFLVGYLLRALESLGAPFAIGATGLVRVLYHLYQGPVGAVEVLVFGLIFAVYFWRTRKLWPLVFAHIVADFAGFALS
jgi:membrane protease YdiL (CAAX protease family)